MFPVPPAEVTLEGYYLLWNICCGTSR